MWIAAWLYACGAPEPGAGAELKPSVERGLTPVAPAEVLDRAPLAAAVGSGEAARAPVALVPESDAVMPRWVDAPIPLAGGARLVQDGLMLVLEAADGTRRTLPGVLLGRPSVSADRATVVATHEIEDGERAALSLLRWDGASWSDRRLIEARDPADRAALDPAGARVAFVWAGPVGGVAGVWTMVLPDGPPRRRTNLAPYTPGRPPADFIPLPVTDPPRWEGDVLRWRSEAGEHSVWVTP